MTLRTVAAALLAVVWAGVAGVALAQATDAGALEEALAAGARTESPVRPLVISGPVDPGSYRLGPGDLLAFQVLGRVSRVVQVEVGPEGRVILPESGVVAVGGLTLVEGRARMLEVMRREYRGVRIEVELVRPRVFRINVTGLVQRPGAVEAQGTARVSDVLAGAGIAANGSRRRVQLLHRDGSRERADLDRLERLGDRAGDPLLRDGDIVHVPAALEFAHVMGAVAVPGRIELAPDDSLRTLLALAGGPLPATSRERVRWTHWREDGTVDSLRLTLDEVAGAGGSRLAANGDRLFFYFVPEYRAQEAASIAGEVVRPGAYPIREGRSRLTEVVAAAGGFLPAADIASIRVHRARTGGEERDPELDRLLRLSRTDLTASEFNVLRTKLAAMREDYRLDWNAVRRDTTLDLLLRDGDVIRVDRLVSAIRVDGEVRRPGILRFHPGMTAQDYVRSAGGFTNRAWRGKVCVTRAVTGQTLQARDVGSLDPGDLVWVPEKPDTTVWEQARGLLSALGTIATIVIAIRSLR